MLPPSNQVLDVGLIIFFSLRTVIINVITQLQYVDEPLGYFTVKNTAIAQYISPNAASLIVSKGILQFGLIRPPPTFFFDSHNFL